MQQVTIIGMGLIGTSIGLALFILLAIDEDPEALKSRTRPFSVQTTDVASPGQHRK